MLQAAKPSTDVGVRYHASHSQRHARRPRSASGNSANEHLVLVLAVAMREQDLCTPPAFFDRPDIPDETIDGDCAAKSVSVEVQNFNADFMGCHCVSSAPRRYAASGGWSISGETEISTCTQHAIRSVGGGLCRSVNDHHRHHSGNGFAMRPPTTSAAADSTFEPNVPADLRLVDLVGPGEPRLDRPVFFAVGHRDAPQIGGRL